MSNDPPTTLKAVSARFTNTMVYVLLNDQREIGLPLDHPSLRWLGQARPEQREAWVIEADGQVVVWDALDDGIEVAHLLRQQL